MAKQQVKKQTGAKMAEKAKHPPKTLNTKRRTGAK